MIVRGCVLPGGMGATSDSQTWSKDPSLNRSSADLLEIREEGQMVRADILADPAPQAVPVGTVQHVIDPGPVIQAALFRDFSESKPPTGL